jgi:large subunit ribosomal protein L25
MEMLTINGSSREGTGKRAAKGVRNSGLIPCVMYGGGTVDHFSVNFKEIKSIVFTPDFKMANVNINGKSSKAILKAVQFHPVTDEIQHIDFLKVIEGSAIKLEVPIKLTGSSEGVKAGGKLQQLVRRVKVKTTPDRIISEVQVDISSLGLGQSVRVRDIKAIEGVEIMASSGIPVATILVPRALRGGSKD